MKGKYVIIDLRTMEFFKNSKGELIYYDDENYAIDIAAIHELEDAWVMKLVYHQQDDFNN